MARVFGLLLLAAAVNMFGGQAGVAGYIGFGRAETWLLTTAVFSGALLAAGSIVCGRWDGVFIDRDNRISLSRFQLIVWSGLIIGALLTANLTNTAASAATDASVLVNVPAEVWVLLGLGAFTAVAAPAIKDGKREGRGENLRLAKAQVSETAEKIRTAQSLKASPTFDNRVLTKQAPEDARWIDLVMGDVEGAAYLDVSKLQQLTFTILLAATYGMSLWSSMDGAGPIQSFPEIDDGFIALLAVSDAAYLVDKQVGQS
nr:hypothetical protein [Mesorhizobium sp.]